MIIFITHIQFNRDVMKYDTRKRGPSSKTYRRWIYTFFLHTHTVAYLLVCPFAIGTWLTNDRKWIKQKLKRKTICKCALIANLVGGHRLMHWPKQTDQTKSTHWLPSALSQAIEDMCRNNLHISEVRFFFHFAKNVSNKN